MKKLTLYAFGALPLISITCFHLIRAAQKPNTASTTQSSSNHVSNLPPQESIQASSPTAEPTLTRQERQDRINDLMANSAQLSTPEKRHRLVDATMKIHMPRYQAMFESWNLDPSTVEDVLQVLRERETEYGEAHHRYNEEGVEGRKNWMESRIAAKTWADNQLMILLNQDQFRQFSEAEAHLFPVDAAKGQRIANETLNGQKN